jgi:hypothetical protein
MTEQERIDRQTLLKRAVAVAGAVYLAPVLTSAAAAGSDGCLNFTCSKKRKKWKQKHQKKCQNSGAFCDCSAPGTACQHGDPCGLYEHTGPRCGYPESCQTGNCLCFLNGFGENPGACIDVLDGHCFQFQNIGTCPDGSGATGSASAACRHLRSGRDSAM